MFKKTVAEFIGTMMLVIFGCGTAVAANYLMGTANGAAAPLGYTSLWIAFAFGLALIAMAYSIGNISGCHINPAVSFGMLVAGRMRVKDFFCYIAAQFAGGIVGAALLVCIFGGNASLGTNGYDTASAVGLNVWGAVLAEIILTFVFVIAVLGVTSKVENSGIAGVVIGLTLTLVHVFGIPLTGTSVNPARSFGPALLSWNQNGWLALSQVWVFIVAPLLGAALAASVYVLLTAPAKEKAAAAADGEAPECLPEDMPDAAETEATQEAVEETADAERAEEATETTAEKTEE